MIRRIASFLMWLGLFGLFLFIAAYSTGITRLDYLLASLGMLAFSALVLRRPMRPFEPSRRFRTLRRLGLTGRPSDKQDK
jgi:hypothetical protein